MATETKKPDIHATSSGPLKTVQKDLKPVQAFITKFNNDWVMNFASGLAFNLITAIFPIVIAIISIVGFVIGGLDPAGKTQLIQRIENVFPPPISSGNVLEPALNSLNKNAGFLAIIAILLAIFGGSRLFVTIEGYFNVIFHTRPRDVIKQNIMAVSMLLVFVVLTPLMVVAGSAPALVFSLLQATPLKDVPGMNLLVSLGGILGGLIVSWILFEAIYIIVPNQHISFRNSWRGAVVAAVALQIYLILFPFYVTHFLNSYTGTAGFAVILLFFFYYFAVILLLGAEINAFFAEKVRETPADIATMVHQLTSHLPTSEQDVQEQASISHKGEEPKEILPKSKASRLQAQASKSDASTEQKVAMQDQSGTASGEGKQKKQQTSSPATSKAGTIIEAAAGTGLAFVVEFFRIRRRK